MMTFENKSSIFIAKSHNATAACPRLIDKLATRISHRPSQT